MFTNQVAAKMIRSVAAAFLFLALSSAASVVAQTHSDDWIKYDSKEGRYSVMLPAQPTVSSQEASSSDGVKFTQYKAGVFHSDVAYMIGYFDYAGEMTFTFDKARDGMVAGVNGTLVRESNARDETGLEYDMRARLFDIGRRIYVLQFITSRSADVGMADVKAAKYFDSFQVVRAAQN